MTGLSKIRSVRASVAAVLLLPVVALAECKLKALEMPVTMVGSRAIAAVGINGKEVKLMIDSGAFFSSLTDAAAAELQLPVSRLPFGVGVQGIVGKVDAQMTTVKRLQLFKGEIPDIDFIVGGNNPGSGAAGLMGRNLLGFADTEYDLARGMIRFMFPDGDCQETMLAYWAGSTPVAEASLPRDFRDKQPAIAVDAKLNGHPVRAFFDTGARTLVSLAAAKRAGISRESMTPAGRVYGLGRGDVPAWEAPLNSFELGGERINNSRISVGDFDFGEVDMLIGIDFFLSHRIYVSKLQRRMYFTYNGGPVFALSSAAPQETAAPEASDQLTDAAAYARRGAASMARRDFTRALADLDRACELEPQVASHFTRRGTLHVELEHADNALKDFDTALGMAPDDAEARLGRAVLRGYAGNDAAALQDLEMLGKTLSAQAYARQDMARLYARLGRQEQALPQWNLWIAAHPKDIALISALNERCWTRTMLNVELDKALDDCNEALDREPKNASYLDSRAWTQLRRGRLRDALSDFDRALKLQPAGAWSLYGRGIARTRLGEQELGLADINAAREARPSIDAEAERYGITPQ